jgi:hypothetical protein
VDASAVCAAAVAHLNPERLATVIVGDRELIGPKLAREGLAEPVVLASGL